MNLFERLDQGRPAPEPKVVNQPDKDPAQRLLDWLQRWNKPTVSMRQICQFGPRPIRDRKSVISATEVLVKTNWLIPIKTTRRDTREWEITRKTIVFPAVTAETAEIGP
jgi:hypothetical protein